VPTNLGPDLSMARSFVISADGGSRGNPGPAAYGAVVSENGKILHELFETIGIATNNVAEYSGLLAALRKVNELDPTATVEAQMDSKLVVEQMSGRWQIKHPDMRDLAKQAQQAHPPQLVTYKWIPRDLNSHADRLANKALDGDTNTFAPRQINFLSERLVSNETPTQIFLVRHGETVLTPERRFSGGDGSDPELSDVGIAQAEEVAKAIATRKPDYFFASPLVRTRQTAEIIQKQIKLDIEFDTSWIECSFGEWDGLSVPEVQALYPSEWEQWVSSSSYAASGGESYEQVAARVEPALTNLAADYPGKKILVVTHNYVIKALAARIIEAPLESVFHLDVAPCSITTINIYPSDGLRVLKGLSAKS